MLRLALWSLLLALVLCGLGYVSTAAWSEVCRVVGGGFLSAGVVLLVVYYVRTPDPPEK
jgi:hypothetical protein